MDIGEQIKLAIRGKGLTMEEAAQKLDMSRATLFTKLKTADKDKEFRQLVQDRLGIVTQVHESPAQQSEKKVGDTVMKYQTVPLKGKRSLEMWIPEDFGKQDVATLKQWISFFELTL